MTSIRSEEHTGPRAQRHGIALHDRVWRDRPVAA
jgi:hypothetical protein